MIQKNKLIENIISKLITLGYFYIATHIHDSVLQMPHVIGLMMVVIMG